MGFLNRVFNSLLLPLFFLPRLLPLPLLLLLLLLQFSLPLLWFLLSSSLFHLVPVIFFFLFFPLWKNLGIFFFHSLSVFLFSLKRLQSFMALDFSPFLRGISPNCFCVRDSYFLFQLL